MSSTTKNIIKVTQLNMQKARHAQIEMLNKLNKCKNPFLIITQEPYCYKSTLALMPQNAKTIPSDRSGHPRASITASNRLQMTEISELKHRDLAAGLITLEGKKTVILSVYLDITKEAVPDHLREAIEYCKQKLFSILVGIDLNAHSDVWGYSNNKRGNELVNYIVLERLELHNKGREYTYECSIGRSRGRSGLSTWKYQFSYDH